jgi:vacuolar protein-sorting-associated protein 4
MDMEVLRRRGVDEINTAIEYDNGGMLKDAFGCYVKGICSLMTSVKHTKNKQLRNVTLIKVNEYIDRLAVIKAKIDTPTPTPVEVTDNKMKIDKSTVSVSWDDVIGLVGAKESLYEAVILPKKFPSMFVGKRKPWSAILLYGPPGTGKSFLAKAVATESNSTFFSVSSSDIMSKWQGESEKMIKTLFDTARADSPSVIFIDEIDSIAGERVDGEQESTRRVKTQLMTEMQGVGTGDNKDVLVLAATNTPWSLDSAFRRRFQKRVYIGLPDKNARCAMFRAVFDDIDCTPLSEMTDGYSGSDISNVARDALMIPIRKCRVAKQFIKVNNERFTPVEMYPSCARCPIDLSSDPSRGKVCEYCGAYCKVMDDLTDDTLEIPIVSREDLIESIKNMHKTVSDGELTRYETWTSEFGQDGR